MKLFLIVTILSVSLLGYTSSKAIDHEKNLSEMTPQGQKLYREFMLNRRNPHWENNGWLPKWHLEQRAKQMDETAKKLLNMWYLPNRSNESSPSSSSSSLK